MRAFHRTIRAWGELGPLALAVLMVGVAYGAQSRATQMPAWLVLAVAFAVLGASSELLFVGMLAVGGAPLVAAAAGLVVNLRNVVYGVAASRFLAPGPARLLAAHFVNDETVAMATGRQNVAEQRRVFWRLGALFLVAWPAGALIGLAVGVAVDPEVLGLDTVFPLVILAMLLPRLRDPDTLLSAGVGAGIAGVTVAAVPAGVAPLLALLGAAAPSLNRRLRR